MMFFSSFPHLRPRLLLIEMKTFLAVMARKLQGFGLITNTANMKWKEGVILTPKDGVVIAAR